MRDPIDRAELERRLRLHEDVWADEVRDFVAAGSEDCRLAHFALFKTLLRGAVEELGLLTASEGYANQSTVTLLSQLAPVAENELPLVEALKRIGLRSAAAGQLEHGARHLEMMANRAGMIGQRQDARSRSAMRYLYDHEVDAGYAALAAPLRGPRVAAPAVEPLRFALVVSGIVDDNSGSRVAAAIAEGLQALGHPTVVVSTGHVGAAGARAVQRLTAAGVAFRAVAGSSYEERIRRLIEHFEAEPVQAALYLTFPMDAVAKIAASVGLAPAQMLLNTSYEQFCGRFDAILETVSEQQIRHSVNPAIAKFVGSALVAGAAIDRAVAAPRAALGVPDGATLFGTFGRLQKCCEPGFMKATSRILAEVPQSVLLLAGPAYDREESTLRDHFAANGVLDRVRFLGAREDDVPSLLKALDVYVDTFPFPGGQSVLEAMWAGLPVVAMRTVPDPNLDPSGTGPTTAVAELFLGDGVPLAKPGDVEDYVALAKRYAQDRDEAARAGEHLARRAREHYALDAFVRRIEGAMVEAAQSHRGVAT